MQYYISEYLDAVTNQYATIVGDCIDQRRRALSGSFELSISIRVAWEERKSTLTQVQDPDFLAVTGANSIIDISYPSGHYFFCTANLSRYEKSHLPKDAFLTSRPSISEVNDLMLSPTFLIAI